MWVACLGPVEDGGAQAGVQAELMALAALGRGVAVELGEQVAGVHRGGQGQAPWALQLLGPGTDCLGQQPAHKTAEHKVWRGRLQGVLCERTQKVRLDSTLGDRNIMVDNQSTIPTLT